MEVSMRRLYLSRGFSEGSKKRMCQRVRRLRSSVGKDVRDAWVPGTGEQLSKVMELVISLRRIRKGEVRGASVPPRSSLELTLGVSEPALGSLPAPHYLPALLSLK